MDKQGADHPKSAPKHALSADHATFRAFVDAWHVMELKALRMERRALQSELELAHWKEFSGYFCIKPDNGGGV